MGPSTRRLWALLVVGATAIVTSCVVGGFQRGDGGAQPADASPPSDVGPALDVAQPPEAATPTTLASCATPTRAGTGNDCGPSGDQDCCASPLVDGGTFLRSFDGVGLVDPGHPATVSPYRLDRYEITVGRFRTFVEAGMGTHDTPPAIGSGAAPGSPASGWTAASNATLPASTAALRSLLACEPRASWTDNAQANEHLPISCVHWGLAFAFCVWDGGRLPTEAEWNFAASGGALQRVYPWSDPPDSGIVNSGLAEYGCDIQQQCASGTELLPVGSKPNGVGLFGHLDLAGNLVEWALDTAPDPIDAGSYLDPCTDCVDTRSSSARSLRGGNFGSLDVGELRAGVRASRGASLVSFQIGFRCARSP